MSILENWDALRNQLVGLRDLAEDASQSTYDLKAQLDMACAALEQLRDGRNKVPPAELANDTLTAIYRHSDQCAEFLNNRTMQRLKDRAN